jgi:polysaccharide export outer membrane protein
MEIAGANFERLHGRLGRGRKKAIHLSRLEKQTAVHLNRSATRQVETEMAWHVNRRSPCATIAVLLVLCVSCCQTPKPASWIDPPVASRLRKSGLIQIGDDLEFTFTDVPGHAPRLTVRVGSDGTIKLPYHVTLTAAGKTTTALAYDVRAAYVPDPFMNLTVSLAIVDFGCLVMGEVSSSGHLLVTSNLTVLRAIDAAGGPTAQADLKNIELRRSDGEIVKVDWEKARKNPKKDPLVTPTGGDVIMVPRQAYRKTKK